MKRHLTRIVACVAALGVLSTAAGVAAATTPVAVEAETAVVVAELTGAHDRIEAAATEGDSVALVEAVAGLRPVLDAARGVARSEQAVTLADDADTTAAELLRLWPWTPLRPPPGAVATLVNSLLAVINELIHNLAEPVAVPAPVFGEPVTVVVPVPGAPVAEPGLGGPVGVGGPVTGEPVWNEPEPVTAPELLAEDAPVAVP